MLELLIYFLACAGITFTIVHAQIMDILKIRPFLQKNAFVAKMIKCPFCTCFYVGIALLWLLPLTKLSLVLPFAASAFTFLWDRIVIFLDDKIIAMENKWPSE